MSSSAERQSEGHFPREPLLPSASALGRALTALEGEAKTRRFYRKTRRELGEEAYSLLQHAHSPSTTQDVPSTSEGREWTVQDVTSSEGREWTVQDVPSTSEGREWTLQDVPSTSEERGSSLCSQHIDEALLYMAQIKSMQNAIDTMRPSSDSVVRTLTGIIKEQSNIIAGLSLTVDTILSNQQEHGKQLRKASYHIAKSNEVTLPAGHVFERKNFTKSWIFNGFPPFKNLNMIELFENWTQPSRANKNDPFLLMMDFYRFYFLHACQPKQEIQKFACRQSGKRGRFPHLQDLPESLVTFLINFVLDGVGLYAEELLLSATECARQRNRFWLGLGNDEARTKTFDKLSEARMKLSGLARVALGRALGDVRAYHFDADKGMLSPPSKKRFCPITTQDSSAHEQANEAEHDKYEAIESVQSI